MPGIGSSQSTFSLCFLCVSFPVFLFLSFPFLNGMVLVFLCLYYHIWFSVHSVYPVLVSPSSFLLVLLPRAHRRSPVALQWATSAQHGARLLVLSMVFDMCFFSTVCFYIFYIYSFIFIFPQYQRTSRSC